jgi:tRNA-uridine 2-sulfurtransferase
MNSQGTNSLGIDKPTANTRVVVAMSGGVDSSVTAAVLAEEGYEVIGITLQLYDHGAAVRRPNACCAGQDIHDARRVADKLGIAHYVLDYEDRFRAAVIDDFADSYLRGETPVPCIRCNQTVKFRDLLATARDLGAEALATGHYVQRTDGPNGPELHRAADPARDQSYFLFATTREQLDLLRFPLGGLTSKDEVRALADRFGLAVAQKPDSQDICFVPEGGYAEVIARLRPEAYEPGDIVDREGKVLGRHDGIVNFTVGQRRGIGIAGRSPLYVVAINAAQRQVVVGPYDALLGRRLTINEINWLGDRALDGETQAVSVKLRAPHQAVLATLRGLGGERAEITLNAPEAAIAPGQACVIYDGERVLGGGWIERSEAASGG